MKLLCIGNSFTASLRSDLPPMAAAEGRELLFANLYIGGCPLRRHAENLERSAADPSFKPYRAQCFGFPAGSGLEGEFDVSANELLARGDWDVVTVQQASHESWDYANYQPWGHAVVEAVRAACPRAEVVVQQTWAYRSDDDRLRPGGAWGFDQPGMADRAFAAYDRFAADAESAGSVSTTMSNRDRNSFLFIEYPPYGASVVQLDCNNKTREMLQQSCDKCLTF